MFNDYYEILGVGPDAPTDEIKKAFRQRAQESHPDHHPDNYREQTEETRLLIEANATLTNSRTREIYDEKWKKHYRQKGTVQGKGGDESDVAQSLQKKSSGGTAAEQSIPFWKDIRLLIFVLAVLLMVLLVAIVSQQMNRIKVRSAELRQAAEQEQNSENILEERLGILLETIERNPEDLPAITEAAVILNGQAKHGEALHLAETGLEIAEIRGGNMPHRVSRNLTAAKLRLLDVAYQSCIQLDDLESAGEYIHQLLELAPDNEQARNALERLERETD